MVLLACIAYIALPSLPPQYPPPLPPPPPPPQSSTLHMHIERKTQSSIHPLGATHASNLFVLLACLASIASSSTYLHTYIKPKPQKTRSPPSTRATRISNLPHPPRFHRFHRFLPLNPPLPPPLPKEVPTHIHTYIHTYLPTHTTPQPQPQNKRTNPPPGATHASNLPQILPRLHRLPPLPPRKKSPQHHFPHYPKAATQQVCRS